MAKPIKSGPSGPDGVRKYNVTIGATTINSLTTGTVTFAVSNVRTTDVVFANPKSALTTGLGLVGMRVSAAGVVTATFLNALATAANTSALNLDVCVARFSS